MDKYFLYTLLGKENNASGYEIRNKQQGNLLNTDVKLLKRKGINISLSWDANYVNVIIGFFNIMKPVATVCLTNYVLFFAGKDHLRWADVVWFLLIM